MQTKQQLYTSMVWFIDRAEFCFDDPKQYKKWKRKKHIEFEFWAGNSTDNGKSILAGTDPQTLCIYEVTSDIADFEIEMGIDGPVISAQIEVLLEVREDLTEETLEHWTDELAGFATATIHIDDDAALETDHGNGFRLIQIPFTPAEPLASDEIPF